MTTQETSLLQRNFKLNLVAIITLVSCTATFVYSGTQMKNEIVTAVNTNTSDISHMKADLQTILVDAKEVKKKQTDLEIRLTKLER